MPSDIKMNSELLSLKWNNHKSSFLQILSTIRKKDIYTDVTIACDGKFYPSHKLVLSTCSEYFEEIFQHTQCKHPVIVLKDIHSEDLEGLLNYMYIGEVSVVQEKLSGFIKAAECLKIKGLAVPDDVPAKGYTGEKRTHTNSTSSESKRRKSDNSLSKSKETKTYPKYFSTNSLNNAVDFPLKENRSIPVTVKDEPLDMVEDSKEDIVQLENNFFQPMTGSDEGIKDCSLSELNNIWTVDVDEKSKDSNSRVKEVPFQDDVVFRDESWIDASSSQPLTYPEGFHSLLYCPLCKYKALFQSDISKHMRKHTGEKPFICQWCSYSSSQSSNLNKHVKRYHDDKSTLEDSGASFK